MKASKISFGLRMLPAALAVMLISFCAGMFPAQNPSLKFLMPGKYETYLKPGLYKVWYFYKWSPQNIEEAALSTQIFADHFSCNYPKGFEPPNIALVSSKTEVIKTTFYRGRIESEDRACMGLAQFELTTEGLYTFSSTAGSQKKYVLAIVPIAAGDVDPPFAGFDNNTLEPNCRTQGLLLSKCKAVK